MKRDRYKTVTNKESFALLVEAVPPETPMGEATFGIEIGPATPVRPVKLKELIDTGRNMKGLDGKEFFALLFLRGALEARDDLALAKAEERLQEVHRLKERDHASRQLPQNGESRRKFGELMAPSIGLPPEESLKHYEGLRPGPRAMKNPSWLLSQEVSRAVAVWAQVALWWVNGRFVPAIYCSGLSRNYAMKIALYIHTFFIAPNGEIGFRVCPYCTDIFWQDQSNQDYCCPAHRDTHRVARWRNEKKLKETEAKKKSVTA